MLRMADSNSGGNSGGDPPDGGQGNLSPEAMVESLASIVDGETITPFSTRDKYLFAYDVLMDQEYIARYVKGLIPIRVVHLPNHRLVWPTFYPPSESALPTPQRTNTESDCVWGILYDARTADFKALDRHLNVPGRYHRKAFRVVDRGGRRFPAQGYVLTLAPDVPDIPPGKGYLDRLVASARERRLPEEWIAGLEKLAAPE
jgi:AIG2-like family